MALETSSAEPPARSDLSYDDVLAALRRSLIAAAANARAFAARGTAGHGLISARGWAELGEIEARLAALIDACMRRELRAEPFPPAAQLQSWLRSMRDRWSGERATIARALAESRSLPLARWRSGAPQLEPSLWPFFQDRTEHLANTLALALNEPAPFRPIVWHPGRKEFRS